MAHPREETLTASEHIGEDRAAVLAWQLWAAVDTDGKRPSLLTKAMDAYQP